VIKGFRDKATERIWNREQSKKCSAEIQRTALRKLVAVDGAEALQDLRIPPGNRLEKLSGSRHGQMSIRINDQWRICFIWKDGNAHEVEIVDYH
jgi:proteic killer suppression protein